MRLLPSTLAFAIVFASTRFLTAQLPDAPHEAAMEVIHGKPFVMVTINGKGPFRFMVDTGTSGDAIITPELATVLQLPDIGKRRLDDPSGHGGQIAPLRLIDTLEVAGIEFYAVKVLEHTIPSGNGPCDGLLGFPLFRGLLLTLDYPGHRVVLADDELQSNGDPSVHHFRVEGGVPIASLDIGDLHVDALIDSGGAGLSVPERLVSRLPFSSPPQLFARAESLSTRFDVKAGKLTTDIRFGDIDFDRPWIEVNPAFPLANFGSVPLQNFVVTFDQDNLLMRIEGPRKHITLGITPDPLHLTDQPTVRIVDASLVPVG